MSGVRSKSLSGVEVRWNAAARAYAVWDGKTLLPATFATHGAAMVSARALQRRRRGQLRPCMCCAEHFRSEGIGHRLCNRCRHQTEGMM